MSGTKVKALVALTPLEQSSCGASLVFLFRGCTPSSRWARIGGRYISKGISVGVIVRKSILRPRVFLSGMEYDVGV